jgi:hypothetical protein
MANTHKTTKQIILIQQETQQISQRSSQRLAHAGGRFVGCTCDDMIGLCVASSQADSGIQSLVNGRGWIFGGGD